MKRFFTVLFLFFLILGNAQNKKNILFLCIDDLRPELGSFGAKYIKSPNIDKLAKSGRAFYNHYVNAPSCGPSRYTMLTGTYGPSGNSALLKRSASIKKGDKVTVSMPEWFKNNGYTTLSLGKVSHHPGGLGGADWNDSNEIEMPNAWDKSMLPIKEWQHPRGIMHGLANGEIRGKKSKSMDVFQATKGEDTIYPDGHIANKAIAELEELSKSEKPFFFAVGLIRPHLPFGAPKKYLDLYDGVEIPEIPHPEKPTGVSTWHKSGEFFRYNTWGKDPRKDVEFAQELRKHYAACVSYADAQVGKILAKLKETKQDKNTIIVLWGDHGWNLGDHNIWGKHNLFEEGIRSPLIIAYPEMKKCGKGSESVVETVDIFPTLCDLTALEIPDFADGISLKPILENPKAKGHIAFAYQGGIHTIRTNRYRFTTSKKGNELYDHKKDPYEIKNIARDEIELVKEFSLLVKKKQIQRKK